MSYLDMTWIIHGYYSEDIVWMCLKLSGCVQIILQEF